MFDDPIGWGALMHATAVATAGVVVWTAGRRLRLALSADARAGRQRLAQLRKLAAASRLTVDESTQRLVGHVGDWPAQVREASAPAGTGEQWQVTLLVDPPATFTHRNLPPSPGELPTIRLEGRQLVAELVKPQASDRMPELLDWMAKMADSMHPLAPPSPSGDLSDVGSACLKLGLAADPILPRWEGSWQQRRLRVESLQDAQLVQVRLALQLQLPGQLWVGGRHVGSATAGIAPVPLEVSGQLIASAAPEAVDRCRELLANAAHLAVLTEHLADQRGSRVHAGEVVLIRPATLWAIAPGRVLQAALATAEAMEAAIEAPWRAICDQLPVEATAERQGGLPVLRGEVDGLVLRVCRTASDGVHITIKAPEHMLMPGLRILPRHPGTPPGLRTGNPILDQHVRIELPGANILPPKALSRLPTDAVLPLLHGGPVTQIDASGAQVSLPEAPGEDEIVAAVSDLLRLMAALPRQTEG